MPVRTCPSVQNKDNFKFVRLRSILSFRMASDARDILGDAAGAHIKSNHSERKSEKKSKRKKPDGMSNEVYGLLSSNSNDPHPLVPTFSANGGYKARARLSCNKARSWKWEEFENKASKYRL